MKQLDPFKPLTEDKQTASRSTYSKQQSACSSSYILYLFTRSIPF